MRQGEARGEREKDVKYSKETKGQDTAVLRKRWVFSEITTLDLKCYFSYLDNGRKYQKVYTFTS